MTDELLEELSDVPQWLCWTYEERDGEKTKPPIAPFDGQHYASSTDPETWGTRADAEEYHARNDTDTEGIGFVLTKDDVYAGADLDGCRDPETGDVEPWAQDVVDELDSYTEASPSETGLRTFLLGFKPDGRTRREQDRALEYFDRDDIPEAHREKNCELEMYDHGRYLTFTGDHVEGTPTSAKQRNQALTDVHEEYVAEADDEAGDAEDSVTPSSDRPDLDLSDEDLLERARNAANGEKFKDLEGGYDGHHGGDTSVADKAFCQMLAFWTGGDRQRIDRLFQNSDRMRDKWDEVHSSNDDTYGEMTIDAALSDQTEYFDPSDDGSSAPDPAELDWSEIERAEAILRTATAPDSPAGQLEHQNGVYGYSWVNRDDSGEIIASGFDTVCNFTLETQAILETYEGDVMSLRIIPEHPREEPYEVKVQPTVFNNARSFREEIVTGRTTWFDPQTHPTQQVLREIRQTVGSQDAPIAEGTEYVGLHGTDYDEWVTPTGTLTAGGWEDNPEYKYYDKNAGTGEMESGIGDKWALAPSDNDDVDVSGVREIVERLGWIRKPERGLPVLGWYFAAPVKPVIHDMEGEFNLLQVTGGSGSGKTSTLQTFYRLFGADPDPYDCGSKAFGIEKKLSSSCGLPIWLDEYKPTDLPDGKLKWLHRRLRGLTREQSYSKGTPDQEEITYRMRAPVVFSGEQTVEEAAVRRRTIMVNFSKESTSGRYQRAFCELTGATYEDEDGNEQAPDGMALEDHALAYYRWILAKDPEELEGVWRDAREKTHELVQQITVGDLDNTEFQGLQTIVFGFELFQKFASRVGTDTDKLPSESDLKAALEHVATNIGPGGRRREHIDEFTELVAQAATEGYIEEGAHYRVFKPTKFETEALAIHMPSTFSAVKRFVRDYNIESEYTILGKNDYLDNFDDKIEQGASYPLSTTHKVRGLDNGKKAVCIGLERAEELVDGFTRSAFVDEEPDEADEDAERGGNDSPGVVSLSKLSTDVGYVTVEATAASVLEPKPWLQAEGTLEEDGTLVDYEARGHSNPASDIQQGATYRIENAQVDTDESGTLFLEFKDGVTEAEEIGEMGTVGLSDTDSDTGGDDSQESDDEVAADGGAAAPADPDDEAVDNAIRDELEMRGTASMGKLSAALAKKHDHPPSKVEGRVEKMITRGDITDQTGGDRDTLIWSA